MAAVTVTSRNDSVFGDRRAINAIINIATTGDTWVTGLVKIFSVQFDGGSAAPTGATFSGGTVTFTSAANTAANVMVVGL